MKLVYIDNTRVICYKILSELHSIWTILEVILHQYLDTEIIKKNWH